MTSTADVAVDPQQRGQIYVPVAVEITLFVRRWTGVGIVTAQLREAGGSASFVTDDQLEGSRPSSKPPRAPGFRPAMGSGIGQYLPQHRARQRRSLPIRQPRSAASAANGSWVACCGTTIAPRSSTIQLRLIQGFMVH